MIIDPQLRISESDYQDLDLVYCQRKFSKAKMLNLLYQLSCWCSWGDPRSPSLLILLFMRMSMLTSVSLWEWSRADFSDRFAAASLAGRWGIANLSGLVYGVGSDKKRTLAEFSED